MLKSQKLPSPVLESIVAVELLDRADLELGLQAGRPGIHGHFVGDLFLGLLTEGLAQKRVRNVFRLPGAGGLAVRLFVKLGRFLFLFVLWLL